MENYFCVRRGTERLGMMSMEGIVQLLKDGESFFEIQIQDMQSQMWIPLSQDPSVAAAVAQTLINAPNSSMEGYSSLSNWKMAQTEKGPFNYLAMVQFLQQNQVTPEDWVTHPRLPKPMMLKDLPVFSDLNVETLFEYAMLKPLFEQRKNIRIEYDNRVLVYGDVEFYSGTSWSLSSKGMGVVLDGSQSFQMGQTVKLHIHKTPMHSAVQVDAKIVSREEDNISTRLGFVFRHEVLPLTEYIQEVAP